MNRNLGPEPANVSFDPSGRSATFQLDENLDFFKGQRIFSSIIDAMPNMVVMLDKNRQIVFSNKQFLDTLGLEDINSILGTRPGEALGCEYAHMSSGGCGTTRFCKTCGAAKAVLNSQKTGIASIEECRINRRDGKGALVLRVWAVPFSEAGRDFTIFSMVNISDEKRRAALERIFFHDILNIAQNMLSLSELLSNAKKGRFEEYTDLIRQLVFRMTDEIRAQRQLAAAERNELTIEPREIVVQDFLKEIIRAYENHDVARGKMVRLDTDMQELRIVSDTTLLWRVLGNMIKNALEASPPGETVDVGCDSEKDRVVFWVKNPGVMPEDAQLQVFRRSFSTKGQGRGLGTYSMKLLSENYLKGSVSFRSEPGEGTVFMVRIPHNVSSPV